MFRSILKQIIGNLVKNKIDFEKKISIFLFHEITDNPSEFQKKFKLYHNIKDFADILKWIKENFNVISPKEIDSSQNTNKRAIITFDDGFYGSLTTGAEILLKMNLPSIHFLNMRPVIDQKPNIVALCDFLENNDENFKEFLNKEKISQNNSFYKIRPDQFKKFLSENEKNINFKKINDYQGPLISLNKLLEFNENDKIFFGSHLFDHWNIKFINQEDLIDNIKKNNDLLNKINYLNFFAFPHGVPFEHFLKNHLNILENYYEKIFYSASGIDKGNSSIYNRIVINKDELENGIFYYKIFRDQLLNKLNEK